jgi:hypothetical protein
VVLFVRTGTLCGAVCKDRDTIWRCLKGQGHHMALFERTGTPYIAVKFLLV